jgi:hypothetical protein
MLNDLYLLFDDIIMDYSVYKVSNIFTFYAVSKFLINGEQLQYTLSLIMSQIPLWQITILLVVVTNLQYTFMQFINALKVEKLLLQL